MEGSDGKVEPYLVARMIVRGSKIHRVVKVGPTPPDGVYRLMGPYDESADQGKAGDDGKE